MGDLAPDMLSQTGRREFRNVLRGHGLELTALGCPLRRGLDASEGQQRRIDHAKAVLELSFALGARVAVVQAGRIPEKEDDPNMVDHPVFFCPFCGTKLQTPAEVDAKAGGQAN